MSDHTHWAWGGAFIPGHRHRRRPGRCPVERFAFEELGATPVQAQLLRGSGGRACALLTGRAFAARGWGLEPGDEREIDDLPANSFVKNGEREFQACAEHYQGEAAGELLLAAGLMPGMSHRHGHRHRHRHRHAVTVMRFQSVALPPKRLGGLGGLGGLGESWRAPMGSSSRERTGAA